MERTKKVGIVKFPEGFSDNFINGESDDDIKRRLNNIIGPFSSAKPLGEPEITIKEEPFTEDDWAQLYIAGFNDLMRSSIRSMLVTIKKELDTLPLAIKEDLKDKTTLHINKLVNNRKEVFAYLMERIDLLFSLNTSVFIKGTDDIHKLFELAMLNKKLEDSIIDVISSRDDKVFLVNSTKIVDIDSNEMSTIIVSLFCSSSSDMFKAQKHVTEESFDNRSRRIGDAEPVEGTAVRAERFPVV
jgi:hypothetical protein